MSRRSKACGIAGIVIAVPAAWLVHGYLQWREHIACLRVFSARQEQLADLGQRIIDYRIAFAQDRLLNEEELCDRGVVSRDEFVAFVDETRGMKVTREYRPLVGYDANRDAIIVVECYDSLECAPGDTEATGCNVFRESGSVAWECNIDCAIANDDALRKTITTDSVMEGGADGR